MISILVLIIFSLLIICGCLGLKLVSKDYEIGAVRYQLDKVERKLKEVLSKKS